MLAIEFPNCGSPLQVLEATERDLPEPKSGELRVRMLYSPLNPSDMLFVRGVYATNPVFPQIPGFEGVGIVEAVGGGLRGRLFRGKRVVVLNQHGGTWAEQAIVPDSQVIPVPNSLSDVQAATSFVNPMTAWMMTQRVLQIPRNAWLIQTAAGSILGRMIIRLGQHLGFRTMNVVRSDQAVQLCRDAGAEHILKWDETADSVSELQRQVTETAGAESVLFAIDAVSGQTGGAVLQCLSKKGRFLAYGTLCADPLAVETRAMMSNQWSIDSFWLGHRMQALNLITKLKVIRKVQKLVQAGILVTPVADVFPIAEFQSAIAMVEERGCDGRVLLSMN